MNERQFIVLKRNECHSFKEIADTLNIMNNKKYSSHFIGNIYRDEIETRRGEESEKSKIEIDIKIQEHEFNFFINLVGEQKRTVNWAVKSIKGNKHYSCSCGSPFLRDIMTKKEESLSDSLSVTARNLIYHSEIPVMSIHPKSRIRRTKPTTAF